MVLVAGLVIVLLDVFAFPIKSPGLRMSLELHAFIDGEGWHAFARQTEMIGAVKMPSLGAGIRTNRQAKFFCGGLDHGKEAGPLSARDLHFFWRAQGLHIVIVQT